MARPKLNNETELIENVENTKSESIIKQVNKPSFDLDSLIDEDLKAEEEANVLKDSYVDISKEKYVLYDKQEKRHLILNKFNALKNLLIHNSFRYVEPEDRQGVYWKRLSVQEQSISEIRRNNEEIKENVVKANEVKLRNELLRNNLK